MQVLDGDPCSYAGGGDDSADETRDLTRGESMVRPDHTLPICHVAKPAFHRIPSRLVQVTFSAQPLPTPSAERKFGARIVAQLQVNRLLYRLTEL
jgi:hypothetical protein